jgi:protein-tyrosine phosphatase
MSDQIAIDSAGTGGWHAGDDMDDRSAQTLREFGYKFPVHTARQWSAYDFDNRDLVVAMDRGHYAELIALAQSEEERAKIVLFRSFIPGNGPDLDVPDPYYGGTQGFENVLRIVEAGCAAILAEIRQRLPA